MLSERQKELLRVSLQYTLSNLDDLNEVLEEVESEHKNLPFTEDEVSELIDHSLWQPNSEQVRPA